MSNRISNTQYSVLRQAFNKYDLNGDGRIDVDELTKALKEIKVIYLYSLSIGLTTLFRWTLAKMKLLTS